MGVETLAAVIHNGVLNKEFANDPSTSNALADGFLVSFARSAMESRLLEARNAGRNGWFDAEVIQPNRLEALMQDAALEKDWVSVMNYAAMLWAREAIDQYTDE